MATQFSEPLLQEVDNQGLETRIDETMSPRPGSTFSVMSLRKVRRVDSEVADNLLVFGRAYVSQLSFWKNFLAAGLLGTVMGFLGLGFFWLLLY